MTDPDPIGEDGFVRLRCYLPLASTTWFDAICAGCQRVRPISVPAAIAAMGSDAATVGQLAGRLRCTGCGGRRISITVSVDNRSPEAREEEGLLREVRAGLTE